MEEVYFVVSGNEYGEDFYSSYKTHYLPDAYIKYNERVESNEDKSVILYSFKTLTLELEILEQFNFE